MTWLKLLSTPSDGMIQSDDIEPVGDGEEDSDEEQDEDATDGKNEEQPTEHECEDHSFLTNVMESFVEKVSLLKTRAGRAGLVHNFLRGLQLMTSPVPSGECPFLIEWWKKSQFKLHGSHNTTPRYGQYLTHAHSHITRAVAAMESCFGLVEPHQHSIARHQSETKSSITGALHCWGGCKAPL